jgi:hypothetical protein
MEMNTDNMILSVQETLDELFVEHKIPFELTAYKVNAEGADEFSVPFYDSRIHSMTFSWKGGGPFRDVVRAAVLDRVKRMTGPLQSMGVQGLTA